MDDILTITKFHQLFSNASNNSRRGFREIITEFNHFYFYYIYNIYDYKIVKNGTMLSCKSKDVKFLEIFKRFKSCNILLKDEIIEISREKEGFDFGLVNQYGLVNLPDAKFAIIEIHTENILVIVGSNNNINWYNIDVEKCELINRKNK